MKKIMYLTIMLSFALSSFFVAPMAQANGHSSFGLYAGQNQLVGKVEVKNDSENLYVKYAITAPGWHLTETHLHIGESINDFPLAGRQKNPVPGQFDHSEKHDFLSEYEYIIPLNGWKNSNSLIIAAHAVVVQIDWEIIQEAPYGGSEVIASEQGLRYDYTPVRAARSNPDTVLSFITGQNEANFYSLGFREDRPEYLPADDAWIIVKFDNPVLNGPGNDLRIVEDTWGLPYPDETADVWASQNGLDWTYLGSANNQTPYMDIHTITDFDLEAVGLDWAAYIKVQDSSLRADFAGRYPAQKETLDGFDVNAVLALNDHKTKTIKASETAWAATGPGENRFTPKGNWATWFTYQLDSKPVSGHWEYIETLQVPATGGTVYSSGPLKNGHNYRLSVSGTYTYNPAGDWADAEWYLKDGNIVKGDTEGSVPHVLDLSIKNGPANIDWGAYNPAHEYSYNFAGTGAPLGLYIYDSNGSDNSGYLTVAIHHWAY